MNRFIATAAVLMFILLVTVTVALSHVHPQNDWEYDRECCHNDDCAPVDNVIVYKSEDPTKPGKIVYSVMIPDLADPKHLKMYSAAVDEDTKFKESKDHNTHACVNRYNGKLICIYLPMGN